MLQGPWQRETLSGSFFDSGNYTLEYVWYNYLEFTIKMWCKEKRENRFGMEIEMKKCLTLLCMLLLLSCVGCGKESVQGSEKQVVIETARPSAAPEDAVETPEPTAEPIEPHSIARLLLLAREPLGQTMYVWGGGWNEEDTGAGVEARTLGVSPAWAEFAAKQDANYDYDDTRYRIHDGLDCSGYIGWLVYNLFETQDGEEGYVMKASDMAADFAIRGWGDYTGAERVYDWKAGDIMSMKGHVWMSLGMCEDGSVVLLHASPPGVILSGTRLEDGSVSQAELWANEYMSTYYPEWYEKYPVVGRDYNYLTDSDRMRWSEDVLSDEQGLREMSAEEVLQWLFEENNK